MSRNDIILTNLVQIVIGSQSLLLKRTASNNKAQIVIERLNKIASSRRKELIYNMLDEEYRTSKEAGNEIMCKHYFTTRKIAIFHYQLKEIEHDMTILSLLDSSNSNLDVPSWQECERMRQSLMMQKEQFLSTLSDEDQIKAKIILSQMEQTISLREKAKLYYLTKN